MPDQKTSQTARVVAVGGLIAAFILVIFVIATSGGGDSGGGESSTIPGASSTGPDTQDPDVRKALDKGKWEVKEGDTLTAIADATGIDEDTLITLNPDLDPQALLPGQRVKLR
jgi:hypothetical protein